ncbi:MAG TPA: hypothetical protein VIK93_03335 [Limnochordales bacterium]
MTGEVVGLAAAVLVLAFGLGYGLGRRQGIYQGFAAGVGYGPLALRQASWERGRCALCGAGPLADAAATGPRVADLESSATEPRGRQNGDPAGAGDG